MNAHEKRMMMFRQARERVQARIAAAREHAFTQSWASEQEPQMDTKPEVDRE